MKVASSPLFCGLSTARPPLQHAKKENYKMVVLSLGTVIFSFLPSYKSALPALQSH